MSKVIDDNVQKIDVVVLGAGPAGVAAATIASEHGADVAIIDENISGGGQIYRAPPKEYETHDSFKSPESYEGDRQRNYLSNSKVKTYFNHRVWSISQELVVSTISANGLKSWRPKALILANGALERIIPFPGWTLPGVMGLAACTILLKSQFVLPGRSTVVAGCGPLLMSVAYAIVKAGGNVSAIVDLSSKSEWVRVFPKMLSRPDLLLQGMKWLWKLKNEGIKIYNGYTVTKSEKDNDRLAITIAPFNHSGVNTDPKFQKLVEGECLAIGHGLIPSTEITRLLKAKHKYDLLKGGWVPVIDDEFRTSIPNVFIAGDASGISGAFSAVHKGRIAGLSALRDLNMISLKESKHKINNERNLLNKTENFGQAAAYLMRSRPELIKTITAETIVCRCEDVFRAEIDETIVSGAVDMNQLKAWTRCGMGPCQGRTCADSIEAILTSVVGSRELAGQWTGRAPLRPIPIEQIIGDYSYSDIPIPESAPL